MGRSTIQMMVGDQLTLPDENGVMTGYIIESIEGSVFEAEIHLKNANGIPEDTRIIKYGRID